NPVAHACGHFNLRAPAGACFAALPLPLPLPRRLRWQVEFVVYARPLAGSELVLMRPRFSVRRARARRTRNGRVREQRARAPRNLVEVVVAELLLGVRGARFRRLEGRT